jgi:hypothetical protein
MLLTPLRVSQHAGGDEEKYDGAKVPIMSKIAPEESSGTLGFSLIGDPAMEQQLCEVTRHNVIPLETTEPSS